MRRLRSAGTMTAALLLAGGLANVPYTIVVPLVPHFRAEFDGSTAQIGWLFAAFALGKGLGQPVGGALSDRLGPYRVAVTALAGAAATVIVVGFGRDIAVLIALRGVWGLLEGVAMPAIYGLIGEAARSGRREEARLFGWFGASAVTGMAAGPGLVALLYGPAGFTGVFLVAGGVMLASAALVAVTSRPDGPRRRQVSARPATPAVPLALFGPVVLLGVVDLLNNGLYGALEPVLPLRLDGDFGASVPLIGWFFTVGLVIFVVVSALAGHLLERLQLKGAAVLSFVVSAAGLLGLWIAGGVATSLLAFVPIMVTQPIVYVITRRSVAQVDERVRGRAFGWFGLVSDLGFWIGPLAGTAAWEVFGTGAFPALAAAAVVTAGICLAAPLPSAPARADRAGRSGAAT